MSIQPQESPGGQPSSAPPYRQFNSSPPPSLPFNQRQSETCPGCREPLQPGQAVCAECGTVLHSQPKPIRCRHCRKEASSAYALCPHCGRALVAAPSLLFTLGMPAGAVLLLALLLFSQTAGNPLRWAEKQMDEVLVVVENPVLTPVRATGGEPPATEVSAQSDGASNGALTLVAPTDTPTAQPPTAQPPTAQPPTAQPPTDTPQAPATPTASPFPIETATATLTNTPSATATRQSVAISDTQTITATLTSAGTVTDRTYTIQEGDTAFSIANRFQVTIAELLTVNQFAPIQALQLKPGTTLEIPGNGPLVNAEPAGGLSTAIAIATVTVTAAVTATQTVTAFPTATPTSGVQTLLPDQQLYTVESGDTFVGIALRFNTSTEALLAANGLTINQARELGLGQKLIIPAPGQSLPPTATPTPGLRRYIVQAGDTISAIAIRNAISTNLLLAVNGLSAAQAASLRPGDELIIPPPGYVPPTATPRPTVVPTATPTPKVTIRLPAPSQIDPAQGINVPCNANQFVRWNPVNGLAPGDEYVLFLGYVNSAPDAAGNVQVLPLLEQRSGQRTNWQMDVGYCGLAPQEFGRRWRWYVQLFNGDTPVSPPSPVWEFTWR
ncbi:MAG: LysM peptidoglycan-binding domain-containing protein [Chloroflexi bacterium]|nr:LysM peptidoglycan-binding domain-containing protein [Chloroflexota bacterium]